MAPLRVKPGVSDLARYVSLQDPAGDWQPRCKKHLPDCREASVLSPARAGDRLAGAEVLNNLGEVQHMTGDYQAAAASQQLALRLHSQAGNRHGQALATGSARPRH
jgi:hypothetical protein